MYNKLLLKFAKYTEYNSLQDIINNTSKEEQLNKILSIIKMYIENNDQIYKFFIDKDHLTNKNDVIEFFNFFSSKKLFIYIDSIKEQIASKYLLLNQYSVKNINTLAIDIVNFLKEHFNIIRSLNKYVTDNSIEFINNYFHSEKVIPSDQKYTKIMQAEDLGLLSDEEDPIGSIHTIYKVDVNNRVGPFVDIDNRIVPAQAGEKTHGQIINRYLKLGYSNDKVWFRTNKKIIKQHADSFAFGHFCKNNVIIIDSLTNTTMDQVVKDLQDDGYNEKIYLYIPDTARCGNACRKARLSLSKIIVANKDINSFNDLFDNFSKDVIDNCIYSSIMYTIDSEFFRTILNNTKLPNMKEIFNFFKKINLDILQKHIQDKIDIISKDILNSLKLSSEIDIKNELMQYINANIIESVQKRIGETFDKYIYDEFRNGQFLDKITQAKDLGTINDAKEQGTYIIRTDFNNRECAFVDADHKILISKHGETHGQILSNYLKEKKNQVFGKNRKRPSEKDIKERLELNSWAFGHICANDVLIIDSMTNITIDEVINDLNKDGYTGKVYLFEFEDKSKYYGLATRKAKFIPRRLCTRVI